MYEVGKKRPDGKFNVWKKEKISEHLLDWIIDSVWDDYPDALEYAAARNRKDKKRSYKVNQ